MIEFRLRDSPVKIASLLIFDKFNEAGNVPRSGLKDLQTDFTRGILNFFLQSHFPFADENSWFDFFQLTTDNQQMPQIGGVIRGGDACQFKPSTVARTI